MGEQEVEAFLTPVAVNRRLAANTQNQALGAILFFYRNALRKSLGSLDAVRANQSKRLPTVLSKSDIQPAVCGASRIAVSMIVIRTSHQTTFCWSTAQTEILLGHPANERTVRPADPTPLQFCVSRREQWYHSPRGGRSIRVSVPSSGDLLSKRTR